MYLLITTHIYRISSNRNPCFTCIFWSPHFLTLVWVNVGCCASHWNAVGQSIAGQTLCITVGQLIYVRCFLDTSIRRCHSRNSNSGLMTLVRLVATRTASCIVYWKNGFLLCGLKGQTSTPCHRPLSLSHRFCPCLRHAERFPWRSTESSTGSPPVSRKDTTLTSGASPICLGHGAGSILSGWGWGFDLRKEDNRLNLLNFAS